MTDDPTPDDPFVERLAALMREATAPIGASGVGRADIDARVHGRQRTRRATAVLGAVAASMALVAGLAVLATTAGDAGTEQVSVAAPGHGAADLGPEEDESTTTTSEAFTTSSTTTEPRPTSDCPPGPSVPPGTPSGAVVLLRPSGPQPAGTVDLVELRAEHRASLDAAGLLSGDQMRLAENGVFVWITAVQHQHLVDAEPDLPYPVAFPYAAYPSRGGGPEPVVLEVDPDCVGQPGE